MFCDDVEGMYQKPIVGISTSWWCRNTIGVCRVFESVSMNFWFLWRRQPIILLKIITFQIQGGCVAPRPNKVYKSYDNHNNTYVAQITLHHSPISMPLSTSTSKFCRISFSILRIFFKNLTCENNENDWNECKQIMYLLAKIEFKNQKTTNWKNCTVLVSKWKNKNTFDVMTAIYV